MKQLSKISSHFCPYKKLSCYTVEERKVIKMVVARVPITPHVIKYYIDTSNINLEDLEKDANLKNINGWLDLSAHF